MGQARSKEAYVTRQERRATERERAKRRPGKAEQSRRGHAQGIPRAQRRKVERARRRIAKKDRIIARIAAAKKAIIEITEEVFGRGGGSIP